MKSYYCCTPVLEKIEFPIIDLDTSTIINNSLLIDDYKPSCSNDSLCELKKKIISDFYGILKLLECGILPDLEFLLLEISSVYISNDTILFK